MMPVPRLITAALLAVLVTSASVRAEDDLSAELQAVQTELVNRLSPAEAQLLERIDALENKFDRNPWLDPTILIAIGAAIAGWSIALFQFFGNRRQRIWELLLESLRWFEGGTQSRSIGIALIESKWQYHKDFRGRWGSILVNQAIYLLTREKSRDAIHERANLYRIMKLLVHTVDPSGHITDFERHLLCETLQQYNQDSSRGLVNLDPQRFVTWREHFCGDTERVAWSHAMSNPTAGTEHDKNAWTRDQALTMFRMYEDKGWAVKQQMLAIFGLLTPVVFGLLAFCANDYFSKVSTTTTVAGWTTFALSLFMAFLVVLSLWHANSDYTRSHRVLWQIRDKRLLPPEILNIILSKNGKIILDEDGKHDSSLWHKGFGYIGRQFIAIMVLALLLVPISFGVALRVTFCAG